MNTKLLKSIDIFKDITDNELKDIIHITSFKVLNKDNILFYEGDNADAFYILLKGQLKLYKTGIKSQEIVLHYFTNPTMVAEMATLENIKFPATATAQVDETLVAIINRESFLAMLKNDSGFSFQVIKSLTKKIKNLEVAINRNLIFDATTKVCSLLKEDPSILITYKNVQIANLLNIAPETLSRTISKLKKINILDENNTIKDSDKLNMFLQF